MSSGQSLALKSESCLFPYKDVSAQTAWQIMVHFSRMGQQLLQTSSFVPQLLVARIQRHWKLSRNI